MSIAYEELNNETNNLLLKASRTLGMLPEDTNEESTKIYLVMPFILKLGYDIFNPSEVIPEHKPTFYTGNDRVDFALCDDYNPRIYIEVKKLGSKLGRKEISWLAKYFNSDPYIQVGILTNGERYLFFTDTEHENLMDKEPFYEFNISRYSAVDEYLLGYFSKYGFNQQCIENCNKTVQNLIKLRDGFMSIYKTTYSKQDPDYITDRTKYNETYMNWLYNKFEIDSDYLPYQLAHIVLPLHKL